MPEKSKGPRRSFSDEFKQDAVDLIVKQGYSFKAAVDAVGVCDSQPVVVGFSGQTEIGNATTVRSAGDHSFLVMARRS